ncbi:Mercuric resistance operon regulatory protein (plasmid) [Streptomyces sp. ADI95-16]|nr:Mercuric resistance operon regulatory protein [Streptomyces sp. ADI95-16]
MDSETLYSIGELSRRSGLPVKTIRFYSDLGIVPPTDRSPAGYRLYGLDALARLDLARTLRELGLDLATVRKVPQVVDAHADALDAQIQTLRLRRPSSAPSRGTAPHTWRRTSYTASPRSPAPNTTGS